MIYFTLVKDDNVVKKGEAKTMEEMIAFFNNIKDGSTLCIDSLWRTQWGIRGDINTEEEKSKLVNEIKEFFNKTVTL